MLYVYYIACHPGSSPHCPGGQIAGILQYNDGHGITVSRQLGMRGPSTQDFDIRQTWQFTNSMRGKHNKLFLGAWLDIRVIQAMRKWLSLHPSMDETAFMIGAIAEELCGKVEFPKEAASSRSLVKFVHQSKMESRGSSPSQPSSGWQELVEVPESAEPKTKLSGARRGNKLLLNAR